MNTQVLVVDDSPVDRRLAGRLLEKHPSLAVSYAEDGRAALELANKRTFDVVVSDLLMPHLNGLQLVAALRPQAIPVVLMTAHGSEQTAVEALRQGAASYVPKPELAAELVRTVLEVVELSRREDQDATLAMARREVSEVFHLGPDLEAIGPLVKHFESQILALALVDETACTQLGVALREALVNAMYHGTLELSSALKEADGLAAYEALARQRTTESPYRERTIEIRSNLTRARAEFVIEDEGPGFSPDQIPDPTDPRNLERLTGRGLLLIRTFMDEVEHNEAGNQITMTCLRRLL
ncbi:MAG: response regulator [Myxococcota bacterium]